MRRRVTLTSGGHREHVLLNPFQDKLVRNTLQQLGLQMGSEACSAAAPLPQLLANASLTELATIIVWKEATWQPMHRDSLQREGDTDVFTAFVPLQNVTAASGALWVRPRSHRCDTYAEMAAMGWTRGAQGWPSGGVLPVEVSAGSVLIIDSRLVHAGGAHSRGPARAVLYFTWATATGSSWPLWLPVAREYYLLSELWGYTQVPLSAVPSEVQHSEHTWTYNDWLHQRVQSVPYRGLLFMQRIGKSAGLL